MSAQASDRIYWAPLGTVIGSSGMVLIHRCPTAVLTTTTTRESLDPMALGKCRYCDEKLPVPA